MRIATIGAGTIAEALCPGWVRAGHEVMIGARSPGAAQALAARLGAGVRSGTLRQAAEFGQVILLGVPGQAAAAAVRSAAGGEGALAGRVVIDCTNALADDAFTAPPGSFTLAVDAVAEQVAQAAPGAQVVKAFNMCAAEVWRDERRAFDGRALAVPLCADDPHAVTVAASLVTDLGLKPLYAGGLSRARLLEAMTAFVMGLWFAGHDARAMLPPLEAAYAEPD